MALQIWDAARVIESSLSRFERYGPAYLGWKHNELLAGLREGEPPLALDEAGNPWLFRYDDVSEVLSDRDGYRAMGSESMAPLGLDSGPLWEVAEYGLITQNPPDHTRIRKAARFFDKHQVKELSASIGNACDRLIDAFPADGIVEFSYEFAFKLPVGVIMRMLNLPAEDEELIHRWSPKSMPVDASPETLAAANEANMRLREYVESVVAERQVRPIKDDIISEIAASQARGELSGDELWTLIVSLIIAGHETTTSTLTLGLNTLLRNPDQLALLRCDPSLLPNATEEILRCETPVPSAVRIPNEDVVLHGIEIPRDSLLTLSMAAANRDPRRFPDPDRFDVTRHNARRHLAFSAGIHRCLGASLAQLEIPIALGALLERLETIEPAGKPKLANHPFRGLSQLPLHVKRKS